MYGKDSCATSPAGSAPTTPWRPCPPPRPLSTDWTPGSPPAAGSALVIADERLSDPSPTDFLLQVRRLDPQAKRILLIKRGNWSSGHPVVSGMALGQVDYHLFDPWPRWSRSSIPASASSSPPGTPPRTPRSRRSGSSGTGRPPDRTRCGTCCPGPASRTGSSHRRPTRDARSWPKPARTIRGFR